jgi:hypothetical protein
MQHKTAIWARVGGLWLVCASACATVASPEPPAPAASVPAAPAAVTHPYRPGEMAVGGVGDEPDSAVGVQLERGFLNQNDVNAVLEKYTPRLIECYERAGDARQYAAGQVKLRFLVAATGEVTDVLVVGNQLGSFPVERCLVVEGRKIPFPKPGGGRASDFDYDIEFRASRPHTVVDWKAEQFGKKLTGRVPALGRCGSPGAGAVAAVAYVKPGGRIVSVGFVSDKPIDTMAAKCVVDQIQSWRLPAEKAHLVRTKFAITRGAHVEPIDATRPAETSPTPSSFSTASADRTPPIGPTARLKRPRRR